MKPIEQVIAEHAATLLAMEGVEGVFEGQLGDGRQCLRIAVADKTVAKTLPREIEGYPVMVVETGPIGPHR